MATYKVQANGQAQKGLKAGDQVVTGGGTYQITGVNADGSYKSTKVSNANTSNYSGTYANTPPAAQSTSTPAVSVSTPKTISSSTSATPSLLSKVQSSGSAPARSAGTAPTYSTPAQPAATQQAPGVVARSSTGAAYNVGSQLGLDFINRASAGAQMTGGDGSTWTKNPDGTVSIIKNGTVYSAQGALPQMQNAFTALDPNGNQYAINSQLGIDFIQGQPAGAQMTGGDGSSWIKNPDGTVTITKNGKVYSVQGSIPEPPQGIGMISEYDLTQYIRQQQQANLEAQLAGLKSAYEQNMNGYRAQLDRLPQGYNTARNAAAAQDALARRVYDERAAAMGISSGASAQAELSRSAALQSALSGIDTAQQNAESDVSLQMQNLTAQYQNAIVQAQANGNATLAEELYKELVRVQELQRDDLQRDRQYQMQLDQLAYNRAQDEYQRTQEEYQRQLALANLGAQYLDYTGLNNLGISTDNYRQQLAAQAAAEAAKPQLTASQTISALKNGINTPDVLNAYEYWYGSPYGGGIPVSVGSSGGSTKKKNGSSGSGSGSGRNTLNGTLTTSQVKELQAALGVEQDGSFGPKSQAAAKAKYGTTNPGTAWEKYQASKSGTGAGDQSPEYRRVLEELNHDAEGGMTPQALYEKILRLQKNGRITTAQANSIAADFGY